MPSPPQSTDAVGTGIKRRAITDVFSGNAFGTGMPASQPFDALETVISENTFLLASGGRALGSGLLNPQSIEALGTGISAILVRVSCSSSLETVMLATESFEALVTGICGTLFKNVSIGKILKISIVASADVFGTSICGSSYRFFSRQNIWHR